MDTYLTRLTTVHSKVDSRGVLSTHQARRKLQRHVFGRVFLSFPAFAFSLPRVHLAIARLIEYYNLKAKTLE